MRSVETALEQVADSIMFMISIVFMVSLLRMTYQYYYAAYGYIMPDAVYEESDQDIESIGTVTEREIISFCISGRLEYDLQIDGRVIEKEIFFPYLFDFSAIQAGRYEKTYVRNSKGEIQMIQFRRINDG